MTRRWRACWRSGSERAAIASMGIEEIQDRLFLPMLTEATRVLAEGVVRSPGDLEMGLILGIGFPPFRGGILHWADALGHEEVMRRLEKHAALGERYAPTDLIKAGKPLAR